MQPPKPAPRFAPGHSLIFRRWKALQDNKDRRIANQPPPPEPETAIKYEGQTLTFNGATLTYTPEE